MNIREGVAIHSKVQDLRSVADALLKIVENFDEEVRSQCGRTKVKKNIRMMGEAVSFLCQDIHVQIGEAKGTGSAGYVASREKSEAKYANAASVRTHTDPVVYVQHVYGHHQDNRASAQVTPLRAGAPDSTQSVKSDRTSLNHMCTMSDDIMYPPEGTTYSPVRQSKFLRMCRTCLKMP